MGHTKQTYSIRPTWFNLILFSLHLLEYSNEIGAK